METQNATATGLPTIDIAERIAFHAGREALMQIEHAEIHEKLSDLRVDTATFPTVITDMVELTGSLVDAESGIKRARMEIKGLLFQAYKSAGATYAGLYAKEIVESGVTSPVSLVAKRSGSHKDSTHHAVLVIEKSQWWQDFQALESDLLAERSRAEAKIESISAEFDVVEKAWTEKTKQIQSLAFMESNLEAQMRANMVELTKWQTIASEGLRQVLVPTVLEKPGLADIPAEMWCAHGDSNVFLWDQQTHQLMPVTDFQTVPGNERTGLKLVAGTESFQWTVRYANYRRTANYPAVELVMALVPAPAGARIAQSTNIVSVLDTSG
ncbi:hypothetical protein ACTXJX_11920 [Glutamicibacter ardleyensis]|uniref:hypothetical protein n=1 Tax=Glutamicibacter ardleyensis TaxID=225894 RepID=UPI003FD131CA